MRGADGAGEAVVADGGEAVRLLFRQRGVRRHDDEHSVLLCDLRLPDAAFAQHLDGIVERAVVAAGAGDDAAGRRVDDVAGGVDGGERSGDEAVDGRFAGGAEAALHRALRAERLADRRAHAGADVALVGAAARGRRGAVASGDRGPTVVAADAKIEQDRGRHDGHDAASEREADATLGEVPHDAGRRFEAERAAAGEHDAVDLLHEVAGAQQIGLVRAGRAAAHVDTGNGGLVGEHDGTACDRAAIAPVADADAGDVGDCAFGRL